MNNILILLIICLIILIVIFKNKSKSNNNIQISPNQNENFQPELKLTEREQINNFNDSFFNFNNRINQLSIYDSPVDKINRDRSNCNFNVGLDIKEIYDNYTKPSI